MRLLGNPASPFARIVRVMASETGLALDMVTVKVHPVDPNPAVVEVNPGARIPAAILHDGSMLYDSRSIARWIAAWPDATIQLYPEGDALWQVLRRESMAHGALDAAILLHYELRLRPEDKLWPEWVEGQEGKIRRFVVAVAGELHDLNAMDAASISLACTLGYLDFRHAALDWRNGQLALAEWYAEFAARPSMQNSAPSAP